MTAGVSVGDLDRAPGAPTAGMMGPTNDLEDPPGLYEKVHFLFHVPSLNQVYAWGCHSGLVVLQVRS